MRTSRNLNPPPESTGAVMRFAGKAEGVYVHAMNDLPIMSEICASVVRLLSRRDDIAAVYVLGSAACGRLRQDSDIDIALMPMREGMFPLQERLALAAELGVALGRDVDLGIIDAGNLIYAHEAILRGRCAWSRDEGHVAAMEMRLLGGYLQLRQDRREVEDAYHAA